MRKPILLVVFAAFLILSVAALWKHGYWGLIAPQLESLAGLQILADLVIALSLFISWMWRDARRTGRNPWPWFVATLVGGSIGALLYLLTRPKAAAAPRT
jgi:hypothetical protein